jgi:hypothetical protein
MPQRFVASNDKPTDDFKDNDDKGVEEVSASKTSPEGSKNNETRSWVRRDSDEHHTPSERRDDDTSGGWTATQVANN